MIAHGRIPRNHDILIETTTCTVRIWNDKIFSFSTSHYPSGCFTGTEVILLDLVLLNGSKSFDETFAILALEMLDILLCESLLLQHLDLVGR
jgi:hypothetical protein